MRYADDTCELGWREGTYPPAPFLRGKGSMGFLIDECKGYFDGFWDLSPGPFPERKGE